VKSIVEVNIEEESSESPWIALQRSRALQRGSTLVGLPVAWPNGATAGTSQQPQQPHRACSTAGGVLPAGTPQYDGSGRSGKSSHSPSK